MPLFLRHIIIELLKIFFSVLIFLTALMVIVGIVNTALSEGVPIQHAVLLVPYVLADQLRISIPMTLLLATTVCFSRMSGSNEIIAVKALGIAPWRLLWPVWILAFLFSIFGVWLNDFAVSEGRVGIAKVVLGALEDTIYSKLRQDGKFAIKGNNGVLISVKRVENKKLIAPEIVATNPAVKIKAEQAEIRVDYQAGELELTLLHPVSEMENGVTMNLEDEFKVRYPISEFVNTDPDTMSPSNIRLNLISEQYKKVEKNIVSSKHHLASAAAFAFITGDMKQLESERWCDEKNYLQYLYERSDRLNAEPDRRWSAGFSCFFFAWIGAPLAIRMQKSDVFASFFACFVPILIFYYPLLTYGTSCAKNGDLPPYVVWVANICLGLIGYKLLKIIHKN